MVEHGLLELITFGTTGDCVQIDEAAVWSRGMRVGGSTEGIKYQGELLL